MLVEGKGYIAPAPFRVLFTQGDIEMLRRFANERDRFRRYRQRSDRWGRGYVQHPIFVGMTGEQALCAYINAKLGCSLSLDTTLRRNGDGDRDLVVDGLVIQVKTIRNGNMNLIRRIDGNKRLLPLVPPDGVYVFAKWWHDRMRVDLKGWIRSRDLGGCAKHVKSRIDTHFNLAVDDQYLSPMSRLVSEIELWRAS